jgi:CRP/FNR family transcriptional regulator, anaerobic regulatory protein
MPDAAGSAHQRPELAETLIRGDEKIAGIMGAADARTFPAGETIIEGSSEHAFDYRLRQGWAGRVRGLPDGRNQFIMIFLPNDLFAVKSMFLAVHPDAVTALSDVVVERINHRELREACDADRDVATRCTWQLIEEERRLHNWVTGLGAGSAEERMAHLLLDFHGRLVRSGQIAPEAGEYDLPMTQEQLGDHLGISTVHVNRVLKGLRENGIATMRARRVRIGDMPALARIAFPLQDPFVRETPEFGGSGVSAEGGRGERPA